MCVPCVGVYVCTWCTLRARIPVAVGLLPGLHATAPPARVAPFAVLAAAVGPATYADKTRARRRNEQG